MYWAGSTEERSAHSSSTKKIIIDRQYNVQYISIEEIMMAYGVKLILCDTLRSLDQKTSYEICRKGETPPNGSIIGMSRYHWGKLQHSRVKSREKRTIFRSGIPYRKHSRFDRRWDYEKALNTNLGYHFCYDISALIHVETVSKLFTGDDTFCPYMAWLIEVSGMRTNYVDHENIASDIRFLRPIPSFDSMFRAYHSIKNDGKLLHTIRNHLEKEALPKEVWGGFYQ